MFRKRLSLRKIKLYGHQAYRWFSHHQHTLPQVEQIHLDSLFHKLDIALASKQREEAQNIWEAIDETLERRRERHLWDYPLELFGALVFALIMATLIRQVVFELYEIPSGSMRPTFREQDHLMVSKTSFGVNLPWGDGHAYFDPELVERGSVFIFSGQGVDLPDTDTRYFFLFPAKKRYIKRNMGKPGDSLYFYGGMLWGVDAQGNDLTTFRQPPFSNGLDHIPYITFEGRIEQDPVAFGKRLIYKGFNQPIGRITVSNTASVAEVFVDGEWVRETETNSRYADFFGMKHFGMTRLLTPQDVRTLHPKYNISSEYPMYLEIAHTPKLRPLGTVGTSLPPPIFSGQLGYDTALLPLTQDALNQIQKSLYTARFEVSQGKAYRSDLRNSPHQYHSIYLPRIPDGTYEFFDGKAYKILWGGLSKELDLNHGLYSQNPLLIQKLFNHGIEFSSQYNPSSSYFSPFPSRYTYYRHGDLYVMGHRLYEKGDPTLETFHAQEKHIHGFFDQGPPQLPNGELDIDTIRTFGITLGPQEYLALGDNHAMSSDSRYFGPVRQDIIEGSPSFIFWPPQNRFGTPNHKTSHKFPLPGVVIWTLVAIIALIVWRVDAQKKALPIVKKKP